MAPANPWTGHTAVLLQKAMRLSNARFASYLGIGQRTVADWHKKPEITQKSDLQQVLDTALQKASPETRERFAELTAGDSAMEAQEAASVAPEAQNRLSDDLNIRSALEWLDRASPWSPGTSRARVSRHLAATDRDALKDRGQRRAQVTQADLTWALAAYYGECPAGYGRYGAACADSDVATTVLTRPEWLDLETSLLGDADRLSVTATAAPDVPLDEAAAQHAVARLAEALTLDVRLVDMPLYRLQRSDVRAGAIEGGLGVDRFARYALTLDLLEAELVDALAAAEPARSGSLPLRDRYLPDFGAMLDLNSRLCAGGALALCAVARPARVLGGPADYVLLVQERSGQVLNAARRLAVIPKGFHQPITDYRTDARIGSTLLREMEEELFGREDVDNTVSEERRADPMHPSWFSEPMRSLTGSGALRMECTGFGLNLISGNYEFAGLVVIDDEDFWHQYGGRIEANWEAAGLRQYSSLDRELLSELAADVAWSNEGLFAFLQGLRRLARIGGDRVDVPHIEWELW